MTDQSFLAAVTAVAAVAPSRTALWDGDRRLSYRELVERGNVLSGRLRGLGIQPGDRAMLVAENSADYLLTAFAVWQAGGVLATVYPSSAASELGYAVTNAAPRLIITQPHLADAITAATADRQIPLRLLGGDDLLADSSGGGDLLAGGDLVAGLPAAAAEPALIAVDPDGPALICYTSGTTSHPKPVTHSHRGLAAAAAAYASVWRLGPQDRTAVCLPMAWAFGLVTTSMAALTAGGTVVSLPRFRADQLLDAIETHRVTFFAGVTTMYVKLVSRLREAGAARDLSSLRLCISGGEPRNEAVFAEWRRLTGRPVHDVYASSECFPVVTYDPELDPQPRPGSAGRAAPGVQIRVVDADGNDVARGVPGEALCRGPALMLGYWEEP
ncbi:MAG: class I adenylate-forming enzyme family protein, partial [Micromonosporaceae bacterium]